jgi:hypothetical protein
MAKYDVPDPICLGLTFLLSGMEIESKKEVELADGSVLVAVVRTDWSDEIDVDEEINVGEEIDIVDETDKSGETEGVPVDGITFVDDCAEAEGVIMEEPLGIEAEIIDVPGEDTVKEDELAGSAIQLSPFAGAPTVVNPELQSQELVSVLSVVLIPSQSALQ